MQQGPKYKEIVYLYNKIANINVCAKAELTILNTLFIEMKPLFII